MNVLVVSSSPRRNGNSRLLAEAALEGAREAGHDAELVHLDDHMRHFLRDCRECRDANGRCTIDDDYERLLRERVLPANAIVFATRSIGTESPVSSRRSSTGSSASSPHPSRTTSCS